ncbi:MAG: PilZ domain-containing protein [Phycisphaeraceae bacterium]|nr:MAG: PilZ domain-containing protein [Phycisphaeraceae bacterium]
MFRKPPAKVEPPAPPIARADPGRRGQSRVRAEGLSCSLGEVVDLSRTGIRVRLAAAPPDPDTPICITLEVGGETCCVTARMLWSRLAGFFRHEAGFTFVSPSREAEDAIDRLVSQSNRIAA